ncbi:eCIS core domain-containing protein [Nitrosospira multiformis]|uniref:eCIS core domain-containing protein n=1 Tax=Nitrosospira multiformis TaxID=1231 RepID=UPI00111336ED|nr:DUF4157 domain-containing protein [Nitrosospira multiformis]
MTGKCGECQNKGRLQAKLTIGASDDPLEQEADRIADQVMAAPVHSTINNLPLRIQCFPEHASEGASTTPASVNQTLTSPGRPLEPTLRQDMEQRFGHDFSSVRVHSSATAEQSTREVNAKAYTVGPNIVFGANQFAPGTHEGRRLIAHELTHVMQQGGMDGGQASNRSIQRKPVARHKVTGSARKKTVVAIHAQPHQPYGAKAYLVGEPEPIPITLRENNLDEGTYWYAKRDKPETAGLVEYKREDGENQDLKGFRWLYPPGTTAAERVVVKIQVGEFNQDAFAKAQFNAVPERIKSRFVKRGGRRLMTAGEFLGFSNFAQRLLDRGVKDEELILFQESSAGVFDPRRHFDWALDWPQAVDEVLGARAALEKQAEENTELFQAFGGSIPDIPEKAYQLYRMSQLMPQYRPAAEQAIEEVGITIEKLEALRDAMMGVFDTRLRLETNKALDWLKGGLLLTRERYVQGQGAPQKIAALRAAAESTEIRSLKAGMEQADRDREAASRAYAAIAIESAYLPRAEALKNAAKTMESASDAYNKARQNYLNGLQDVSGLPVASWRGFNINQFFFGKSAERSKNLLHAYIEQTLRDLTRARRELSKDRRTIYKADIMVQWTKHVLGVKPGSTMEKFIDDRVDEYKSAPWWERLLDILSLALVFVPGGALIAAARLGVNYALTIKTINEEALSETLFRVGMKQEGGSAATVALSLAGTATDIGDVPKALKGGSAVLDTASQAERTLAKGTYSATATTTGAKAESRLVKETGELPASPHRVETAQPHGEPAFTEPLPRQIEPESGAARDSSIETSSHLESRKLTQQQIANETKFIEDNPHLVQEGPPRSIKIGEHEWIESPNGDWCRHSNGSTCVPKLRVGRGPKLTPENVDQIIADLKAKRKVSREEEARLRAVAELKGGIWNLRAEVGKAGNPTLRGEVGHLLLGEDLPYAKIIDSAPRIDPTTGLATEVKSIKTHQLFSFQKEGSFAATLKAEARELSRFRTTQSGGATVIIAAPNAERVLVIGVPPRTLDSAARRPLTAQWRAEAVEAIAYALRLKPPVRIVFRTIR